MEIGLHGYNWDTCRKELKGQGRRSGFSQDRKKRGPGKVRDQSVIFVRIEDVY